MGRRILYCFTTLIFSVSLFVGSIVPVRAIGPQDALIASAIFSFVSSAGIHLFRDGLEASGAEDALVDDMQTLWDDFVSGFDGNVPTWDAVVGSNSINVSSGKFIYDYSIAYTLQDFVNWVTDKYNFVPGGGYVLIDNKASDALVLDRVSNIEDYRYLKVTDLPIYFNYANSDNNYYYMGDLTRPYACYHINSSSGLPVYCVVFCKQGNDPAYSRYDNWFFSTSPFEASASALPGGPGSFNGIGDSVSSSVDIGGQTFYFYVSYMSFGRTIYNANFTTNYTPNFTSGAPVYEAIYAFYHNDIVTTGSRLVADVANSVNDLVYNLIKPIYDSNSGDVISPGQNLAIDVGLGADATEDNLIDAVVGEYSGIGDIEISTPIAMPVPIEGTTELYPQVPATDVEGLGLPALGQALTTRFPFCIPFDIVNAYKSLAAAPVRPVFNIDVLPASFKNKVGITSETSITLDFGDPRFSVLLKIVRWSCLFGFCLVLATQTKRLIWTTGG